MKRLVLILVCAVVFVLVSILTVRAAPFLVCDPQPGEGVEWYVVNGLPEQVDASRIPPDATGTCGFKPDIAATPPGGPYTVTAKACKSDVNWGTVRSRDSLPFVFSRPSALTAPAAPRLSK